MFDKTHCVTLANVKRVKQFLYRTEQLSFTIRLKFYNIRVFIRILWPLEEHLLHETLLDLNLGFKDNCTSNLLR